LDPDYHRLRSLLSGWRPGAPLIDNVNAIWAALAPSVGLTVFLLYFPLTALIAWLILRREHEDAGEPRLLRPFPIPLMIFPLLLLLDCCNPYLGLKT